MSDLRYDPINNIWVAIARNRLQRPSEYVPIEQVQKQLLCPFCRGNEEQTPLQLAAFDENGKTLSQSRDDRWSTRVVPNKYPSFSEIDESPTEVGPYAASNKTGWQEIIVPTPRHVDSLSQLTDKELDVALVACGKRHGWLSDQDGIEHAMLFMNCRSAAGASLSHIHLQLIGSPLTSPFIQSLHVRNNESIRTTGMPIISVLSKWEREQQTRIVCDSEQFDVYCPFASRFPLQTYIVPKSSLGRFSASEPGVLQELGRVCRLIVQGIETILERPAYNILLHTPFKEGSQEASRWFVEIFPRLTCTAGFEWGTDSWVNPVSPESAAKRLRAFQNELVG